MEYGIYELLWMFLIYAFLGWCVEVIYHALECGDFNNRGFLNGTVCPIYGVGATVVITVLMRVDNLFLMFLLSMILTSFLELVTGFALKKIYNTSWWDYSDEPFNLGGYICLKFSILWGLACVGVTEIVHPLIMDVVYIIPRFLGNILLIGLLCVFIADIIVTVTAMNSLTKRMKLLDEIAHSIRRVSDNIGEGLYERVEKAEQKKEEFKESDEAKALKKRYDELIAEKKILQNRIIKAFPKMKHLRYGEQLEGLKAKLKK